MGHVVFPCCHNESISSFCWGQSFQKQEDACSVANATTLTHTALTGCLHWERLIGKSSIYLMQSIARIKNKRQETFCVHTRARNCKLLSIQYSIQNLASQILLRVMLKVFL